VAVAVAAEPRLRRRPDGYPTPLAVVVVVLALATGVGATWKVVQVGHSGSKAAWHDIEQRQGKGGRGKG
jgi:hypothetical protein